MRLTQPSESEGEMEDAEYLLPLDSREYEIDLRHEMRRTLVEQIRGNDPSTVLGVLLASKDGLTVEEIAERLDRPTGLVVWNVEKLEDDDLCVRIPAEHRRKVRLFAPFTEQND
jgi:DNA-directed RNA polymerase specialized sigma24 family protein